MPTATVGILKILLSASTAEFEAGMKKASSASSNFLKELKASGNEAEKVSAAMANAFKGAEAGTAGLGKAIAGLVGLDVIQQANTYAKAVESIGGASKLTAAEQAKVNASVTQAIEKYQVIGREAPAALKALQQATMPLVDANKQWVDNLNKVGDQATQAGMTLTKALTVPIVGMAGASLKAAIDFESSFANVAKTVDGLSDSAGKLTPQGEALARTFRNMAKEIPVTTDELTKIAALGGQMGVPIDQLAFFTKNVAALGIAVDGISTEEAASSLASIGNAAGIGTTEIAQMASAVVHLGNKANATEAQILEFSKRLTGAATSAKMSVADVFALSTVMANVGIEAEAGGTAMSTVIGKISKAVSTGSTSLDEFAKVANRSAKEFAEIWKRSPIEAMDLFVKGLGVMKARGVDLNLTMGELGTEGIRVASMLKLLAGATMSVSEASKLSNEGYKAANKHLEEAEKKYATTEKQLVKLWNVIKDVGITIGNALLPGLKSAVGAFESILPLVDGLAKGFAAMPGGMQLVVVGFFGILAAAGPVLIIFGAMAKGAADLIAMFGKQGIATSLLATETNALGVASSRLSVAMGLLGKAVAVAGAAFIGWEIGTFINKMTGADVAIANVIERLKTLAGMQTAGSETAAAKQDSINLAIKRGADAYITYTDAIKFNAAWMKKAADDQAWWNTQTTQGAAAATATGAAVSKLAALNAQYAEDMKKIGARVKEILPLHDQYKQSAKEIATELGVAETTIDRYLTAVKASGKATKDAAKEMKESTDFVFKFNKTTQDLVETMTKLDAAQEKAFTGMVKKALQDLDDDSRKLVDKWKKMGEEAGEKFAAGLKKSNEKWLDDAEEIQRRQLELMSDSLEKQQLLIRASADKKRRELDKENSQYQAFLDIINQEEAKQLADSEKQWKESQARKSQEMLDKLGRAFEQLANIAGGSFGGILKDIGEMIAMLSLADQAGQALADSFKNIGKAFDKGGTFEDKAQAIASAAGALLSAAGVIAQATDPSHKTTKQTTAGGALAGAKIGANPALMAATGGLSLVVGAGVGALVGWWRGSHAEWKKVAKDIGKDIGQDISNGLAMQIADMAKTLEGGTKQQRREMAELFSLDAIIAEAGGLKSENIQKYEKQAAKLFEIIQRGGENGAKATQELNTLIGEFAAHAAKTGGMWDPVFKKLIADSKALGINLDSVNALIDEQISKLSSGLAAAAAGAFPKGDIKLDTAGIAKAQEAFDRLSRTALASFNAIIASGRTAFEAIAEIGPTIDILIAKHDELGLQGGAAFDQLARFRILTEQNKELVASVAGLNDVMVALANLGGLNADVLADLEAQGRAAFDQLIAAGFTEQEALLQMVPLLESIIQAHRDLGIPIDENTQKLIDQAEANGYLSDEAMSMNDILLEGFAALIEAVGGELPEAFAKFGKAAKEAAKAAKDGIDKIPRKVDVEVNYHPGDPKPEPPPLPPPDREPGDTGRRFAQGGVIGASMGRIIPFPGRPQGIDTVPVWAAPGEGVLNRLGMSALGRTDFAALNAGINPMRSAAVTSASLQRTGTDNQQVTVDVTVAGDIIDSQRRAVEVGTAIGRQLRTNAQLRDVWRTPIKGITGSGL